MRHRLVFKGVPGQRGVWKTSDPLNVNWLLWLRHGIGQRGWWRMPGKDRVALSGCCFEEETAFLEGSTMTPQTPSAGSLQQKMTEAVPPLCTAV